MSDQLAVAAGLAVAAVNSAREKKPSDAKCLGNILPCLIDETTRYFHYLFEHLSHQTMDYDLPSKSVSFKKDVRPSVREAELVKKYHAVLELLKLLEDKSADDDKIQLFKNAFYECKHYIAKHRDPAGLRWLRNVSYILGTIGLGVIIPYVTTGKFTLFSSEGSKFNHNIEKHLELIPTPRGI